MKATVQIRYVLRLAFGLRRPRSPVRGTDVAGVVEAEGYPLAGAAQAVAHMLGHHAVGKVAITV